MNPIQLIQFIKGMKNPQQAVMGMLEQNANGNPLMGNLLQLAKTGNTKQIEQIARNMCQEKGIDFDKEFNNFRNNLGL